MQTLTTQLSPNPVPALPATFAFSQSSLQAYQDCPRRFWLAYIEQLPWPALEVAPIQEHEHLMRLGETLHKLVERAEQGLDPNLLALNLPSPLNTWFDAYRSFRPSDLPSQFIEIEKVIHVAGGKGVRFAAKYDLIAAEQDGPVVIVDWKTARKRPSPATLRQRVQTWIYPFILVEAGDTLPWGPVRPEQIEMRYWFTAAPSQPISFRYDAAQHERNRETLQTMIQQIVAGKHETDFPRMPDSEINRKRFCNFCIYRSRCNRGQFAGNLADLEDDEQFFAVDAEKALEFTLDDVEELAF